MQLDPRDIQILRILATEGRISKADLARRVNLSASPCWERLKRLEDAGLIRGYRADIDLSLVSAHVVVFVVVELDSHKAASFRLFEAAVARHDEIVGCWAIGGGVDYLMQVVTSDINSYQRLIDTLLESPIGMARYFTYVVTKHVKSGAVPLAQLLGLQTD